jgi:hypothetical protein
MAVVRALRDGHLRNVPDDRGSAQPPMQRISSNDDSAVALHMNQGQSTLTWFVNFMKVPLPVRIIAALFGLLGVAFGLGSVSLFVRDVSRQPIGIQIAFVCIGAILSGTSIWICVGLRRRSRHARTAVLSLCWAGSLWLPIHTFSARGNAVTGVVILAIVASIYGVLTSGRVRNGFFGLAPSALKENNE